MKKELILELFGKFEEACRTYKDIEYWSARELQEALYYTKWSNFLNVINKAKKACENAGFNVSDHFADTGKMISKIPTFTHVFWPWARPSTTLRMTVSALSAP